MPSVFVYGFSAEYSGDSEYHWQHPDVGAWHDCLLFLAQDSTTANQGLARQECAKFGFKNVTIDRSAPLNVEVLSTESYRGFAQFYEGALREGSAMMYYPNKKPADRE